MKKWWYLAVVLGLLAAAVLWPGETRQEPQIESPQGQAVRFTNLRCRVLGCCDGQQDVTALLVENTGNVAYSRVQLVVIREGKRLYFDAGEVPAGGQVLILERNRTAYTDDAFEDCYCLTAIPESVTLSHN